MWMQVRSVACLSGKALRGGLHASAICSNAPQLVTTARQCRAACHPLPRAPLAPDAAPPVAVEVAEEAEETTALLPAAEALFLLEATPIILRPVVRVLVLVRAEDPAPRPAAPAVAARAGLGGWGSGRGAGVAIMKGWTPG